MDAGELTALRDAIDGILKLPSEIRGVLLSFLAPAPSKAGNGADPHPPTRAKPHAKAKTARPSEAEVRAAEDCVIAALRERPENANALAVRLGANASTVVQRLKRLEKRGTVERDAASRIWREVHRRPQTPPPA